MRIVIIVYDGVLADECEAFRSVLGGVTGADVITVAATDRPIHGVGGRQTVDSTWEQISDSPLDVVIVPGGLGCERAADDPAMRSMLTAAAHSTRFLVASSTGSVVLAAAGVLHGQPAATHWLAGHLLERYGSDVDQRRLVINGNVITCEGRISAVDAAFAVVERVEGSAAVERIRADLLLHGAPLLHEPSWRERLLTRLFGPQRAATDRATLTGADGSAPLTPLTVMIELVDDDATVRRMRRRAKQLADEATTSSTADLEAPSTRPSPGSGRGQRPDATGGSDDDRAWRR